jgi:hypothetical protein
MTLTVACVLKSGGTYLPEDVRKLYRGVERHMTGQFEFCVLTDLRKAFEDDVNIYDYGFNEEWPSWWSKIALWDRYQFDECGSVLYLDLDTIITGSLDEFVERASSRLRAQRADLMMLQDRRHEVLRGSGIMYWERPELLTHLYDRFASDPEHYMQKYSMMPWLGDQAYTQQRLNPNSIATFAPGTTACLNLDTEAQCREALVCYNSWVPKLPEMAEEDGWRGELVRSAWT